ncbi:hypothetical protein [Cardinium endosymbiont of Nabis limbatus]|uniref:hypothetical protein n=1 Tax=Cardinium endosymbiont of Nabis limbatus TaxID=3066217 RepID=UPI003AF3B6C2
MKKYTQYRPLFFMALLGFNTLSACIGTRQELGVRNRRYERDYMEGNLMGMWNSLPGSTKGCIKVVGAGVVCVGILGGYRLYHFTTPSNAVGLNMNNGTIPFNFTAIPLSDMSALNKTVTQAIEKGNQTWGDGSSTELPLSSTTIEDPITTVKSTTSTEQPSSTTTAQPDDGVSPVKDSMVIDLDDEIMEYFTAF